MNPPKPKHRKIGFLLSAVTLGAAFVLLFTWRLREPVTGLVIVGPVTLTNNQFRVTVTNISERVISCQLSLPQYKRAGAWEPITFSAAYFLTNGQQMMAAPDQLSPAGSLVLSAEQPRAINAPFEASVWRVGVLWSYDRQTTWERWLYQAQTWTRRKPHPLPVLHTNYSSEVKIGSSRLPKPVFP